MASSVYCVGALYGMLRPNGVVCRIVGAVCRIVVAVCRIPWIFMAKGFLLGSSLPINYLQMFFWAGFGWTGLPRLADGPPEMHRRAKLIFLGQPFFFGCTHENYFFICCPRLFFLTAFPHYVFCM